MTGIPDQPIVAPLGRDPMRSAPLEGSRHIFEGYGHLRRVFVWLDGEWRMEPHRTIPMSPTAMASADWWYVGPAQGDPG